MNYKSYISRGIFERIGENCSVHKKEIPAMSRQAKKTKFLFLNPARTAISWSRLIFSSLLYILIHLANVSIYFLLVFKK